jgi:hypothetical protein
MKQKAVFFLRHNNDIDHIVPIIYKWLKTTNIPTDIILTGEHKYTQDYRINYLRQFLHVNIYHINDLFNHYSLPYLFNQFYYKFDDRIENLTRKYESMSKKYLDKIINHISKKIYNNMETGIICFDWYAKYFAEQMTNIAHEHGFTTISLPHGDRPYYSILETNGDLNFDSVLEWFEKYRELYDYVVVPNNLTKIRYDRHLPRNRIKVLGSPRYSDEWIKIISNMLPVYETNNNPNDKLKVLLFLRNDNYTVCWNNVIRTIRLLLQFKEVYLVLKFHPRQNEKKFSKQLTHKYVDIKQRLNGNLEFVFKEVDSNSLIRWADIVIDVGTSATWEAVKMGKPVLMLEYVHANLSTVAHYMPNCEIRCRDELFNLITLFTIDKKGETLDFYYENERQHFIQEIIDYPDKQVLERYVNFLKGCL